MTVDWLALAGTVLVLDQVTKTLAWSRTPSARTRANNKGLKWPRIRAIKNARVGLGFVRRRDLLLLLWAVAVAGTIALMYCYGPLQDPTARLGLGAALGGATGNLIDMLKHGAVVDFIDLRFWPVFNLADTAIVLGLCLTAWQCV